MSIAFCSSTSQPPSSSLHRNAQMKLAFWLPLWPAPSCSCTASLHTSTAIHWSRCPPFCPAATSPVAGAVVLGEPRAAAAAAARRLGLHYLQRYFFLIAFR